MQDAETPIQTAEPPTQTPTITLKESEFLGIRPPGERAVPRRGRLVTALVIGDAIAIVLSLQLAIWIAGIVRDNQPGGIWMRPEAVLVILTSIAFLAVGGMYRCRHRLSGHMEVESGRLLTTLTIFSFLLLIVLHGAGAEDALLFDSELFAWWLIAFGVITASRGLIRSRFVPKASERQRALIVGAGRVGQTIAGKIRQRPDIGVEVVGFVDNDPIDRTEDIDDIPVLGTEDDLIRLVRERSIDRLIISFSRGTPEEMVEIIRWSDLHQIHITIVPRYFDVLSTNVDIDAISGIPVLDLRPAHLSKGALAVKRATDLTLTLLFAPILVPLFTAIAIAIRLDSPGPIFFRQARSGQNGRVFRIFKFRTMVVDAESQRSELLNKNEMSGPLFKIKDDPRVTRVGRFLRKTSLDELPQLINVLRGEMSLVGPRPFVTYEDENITGWARRRLDITPGITGLWQIMGRNDMPFDEMVKLDHMYVTRWSLAWDLKILLRTIPSVLLRRGAY